MIFKNDRNITEEEEKEEEIKGKDCVGCVVIVVWVWGVKKNETRHLKKREKMRVFEVFRSNFWTILVVVIKIFIAIIIVYCNKCSPVLFLLLFVVCSNLKKERNDYKLVRFVI